MGYFILNSRSEEYESPFWNVAEYAGLFLLVLLHEFGHSLACRQVGGMANQIILWPLGGVAYVAPPFRPGATLWSIAAGPLVNVVLVPVFMALGYAAESSGLYITQPSLFAFLQTMAMINLGLLIFNMLPIYPLDGGQILRSLLWFWLGPARSLRVATSIGFVGAAALVALALTYKSFWLGIMAAFMLMQCYASWKHARMMADRESGRPF